MKRPPNWLWILWHIACASGYLEALRQLLAGDYLMMATFLALATFWLWVILTVHANERAN